MENQGILGKAVDVAAEAMRKQQGSDPDQRASYTEQARTALGASIAPLLAAAWDAGQAAGDKSHNPYMAGTT